MQQGSKSSGTLISLFTTEDLEPTHETFILVQKVTVETWELGCGSGHSDLKEQE